VSDLEFALEVDVSGIFVSEVGCAFGVSAGF